MTRNPRLYFPSKGSDTQDFYALKKCHRTPVGFESANLGSSGRKKKNFFPYPLTFSIFYNLVSISPTGLFYTSFQNMLVDPDGAVVIILPTGSEVCGFKPGWGQWIFQSVKILSMTSFGRKVKPLVPCHTKTSSQNLSKICWTFHAHCRK